MQHKRDDPCNLASPAPTDEAASGGRLSAPQTPQQTQSVGQSSATQQAPGNGTATSGEDTPYEPNYTTRAEVESLGVSLGPSLHDACGDRLGDIEWFQSPWQKSGAATGLTSWRLPNGEVIEAIVKAPVGYREYDWSVRLGEVDPMWWKSNECQRLPVPRILASGLELGGYDIAWIVQEKVIGSTVGKNLNADSLEQLFLAAARFHAQTREVRPAERSDPTPEPDWRAILARARTRSIDNNIESVDDWVGAIDAVGRILPALLDRWHTRPMDSWCHGDLHPGNVMIRQGCMEATRRSASVDRRCGVLIDFSLVHPGHWVEDALFLERMYWGREDALCGIDPLRCLAEHRALLGLHADDVDDQLADIRRLLMGVTSPAFLHHENDPVYLRAALAKVRTITPKYGGSL